MMGELRTKRCFDWLQIEACHDREAFACGPLIAKRPGLSPKGALFVVVEVRVGRPAGELRWANPSRFGRIVKNERGLDANN